MLSFRNIVTLFLFGSIAGWIYEVIYNIIRSGKVILIGQGLLYDPYIPIYGFGVIALYLIYSSKLNQYLKISFFLVLPTLWELVVGLFFLKVFGLRLWNYSTHFMNYEGIISLRIMSIWIIFSIVLYFLFSGAEQVFAYVDKKKWSQYILYSLLGIMSLDFIITILQLAKFI